MCIENGLEGTHVVRSHVVLDCFLGVARLSLTGGTSSGHKTWVANKVG